MTVALVVVAFVLVVGGVLLISSVGKKIDPIASVVGGVAKAAGTVVSTGVKDVKTLPKAGKTLLNPIGLGNKTASSAVNPKTGNTYAQDAANSRLSSTELILLNNNPDALAKANANALAADKKTRAAQGAGKVRAATTSKPSWGGSTAPDGTGTTTPVVTTG